MRGKSPNVLGQAYAFMAMTPIKPGEEQALADYLQGLPRGNRTSPLARLQRTHLARWVIVEHFHNDATWKQRKFEDLEQPWLIFTSNFDGDLDSYLDDLCTELAPEAQEIWGRCIGCPEPAAGAALKRYLKHNQIDTGLFFGAYPDAPVGKVRDALAQREQLIAFARRSQALDPAALQAAFVEEFGS